MIEEHDNNCVWYMSDDEMVPPKACLMHPETPCTETYQKPGRHGFGGLLYGLCSDCVFQLASDSRFIEHIDEEIEERLMRIKNERMQ